MRPVRSSVFRSPRALHSARDGQAREAGSHEPWRDERADRPESADGRLNVDPLEDLLWGPFREWFGLTAEQWKRLTVVVTLHMALDRFL